MTRARFDSIRFDSIRFDFAPHSASPMTRATPARARERDIVGWARVAPRVERASRARDARGATLGRAGHVAWYDARENVVACAGGRAARGTCAGVTIGARRARATRSATRSAREVEI